MMRRIDDDLLLVIADAGPVIHLDELNHLWVMNQFSKVLVPKVVAEEVLRHRPFRSFPSCFEVVTEIARPVSMVHQLAKFKLQAGETDALLLAWGRDGALFLTDDLAARTVAKALALRVHGTIGILIRAHRVGLIQKESILALLDQVPARSSLYIHRDILAWARGEIERHQP